VTNVSSPFTCFFFFPLLFFPFVARGRGREGAGFLPLLFFLFFVSVEAARLPGKS